MRISAIIYKVEGDSFFTVVKNDRKEYFYLQKHLQKKFFKYLQNGTHVVVEVDETKKLFRRRRAYKVLYFCEISYVKPNNHKVVHYDLDVIRNGIKDLTNQMDNVMFLDFEMNMQDYRPIPDFIQEIIEAGYVMYSNKKPVEKKNFYIKPTKFKTVTKRAMKFLHYNSDILNQAIPFNDFYKEFKKLIVKYDPYVIVWGKSDISTFKKSLELNGCDDLDVKFVNLLQLHANYYNLEESPGLFKMYEKYYGTPLPEQQHNSLEDAIVTKDVFIKFKETINA